MHIISDFKKLIKAYREVNSEMLKPIKVAILGNHSTQFFSKAMICQLKLSGFNPKVYESDYDQIDITVMDSGSAFYQFHPEFILFFESTLKLRDEFYAQKEDRVKGLFSAEKIKHIKNRIKTVQENGLQSKIILFSYELLDDQIYGNYFANINHSFYSQLFHLNNDLIKLVQREPDLFLFEINKYLRDINGYRDWAAFVNSDMHYTLDACAKLAYFICQMISSITGNFKKCLILDLDNTIWGGIIGDDGIENIQIGSLGIGKAYSAIQKWAKSLKERGVILAVCSKNDEKNAKEAFEKHNEMILKLTDIAVFVANWENKADNIRYIQKVLNIGFDSMVFIDDSPAEREIVRQNIPEVTVPELPEDPAYYLPYLISLNLFDTASYSVNDQDRTMQYQQEAQRQKVFESVTNMDEYLKSLKMAGEIAPFKKENVSRIAQLTQRSNQFNVRTIRYTEADITNSMQSENNLGYTVNLKDKFGDYGLISVVLLKKQSRNCYFIDTWIMSCRVLKRGVEAYLINHIIDDLKKKGVTVLKGEYIKTAKNNLAADLFNNLGFEAQNKSQYNLELKNFVKLTHFIS